MFMIYNKYSNTYLNQIFQLNAVIDVKNHSILFISEKKSINTAIKKTDMLELYT